MNRAIIGIGSNIEPDRNVDEALRRIGQGCHIVKQSGLAQTRPIGPQDQGDFLNGAVLVETEMTQEGLRDWLKAVEDQMGRTRTGEKFGPRTIDLDIVVWNGHVVDEDVHKRDFLRRSVLELCPDLEL